MKLLSSEYATYRNSVQEYIKDEILSAPATILDPMAGTAPLIPFIEKNGHNAYLYDVLPIHFFVNSAKKIDAYNTYKKNGTEWFYEELKKCLSSVKNQSSIISDDWYDKDTLKGLCKAWQTTEKYEQIEKALLKALLLVSLRNYSSFEKSKNRTWVKAGGISSYKSLDDIVDDTIQRFEKYYKESYENNEPTVEGSCVIDIKNAITAKTPKLVDLIVTSPPYPNRLDYHRLYGPENFFLSNVGFPVKPSNLIGTNTVRAYDSFIHGKKYLFSKSPYLSNLITTIEQKKEKDVMYYSKYYTRYFDTLFRTFENIIQSLSKNGKLYVVVQDNMHRGEIIEIDTALSDLLKCYGFQTKIVFDEKRHHLGLRNVSKKHFVIRKKHPEKIMVAFK